MTVKHPSGSVQGICSGAVALLALLVVFTGYSGYGSKDPGPFISPSVQIIAIFALLCLAFVPWFATRAREDNHKSIQIARFFFLLGAFFAYIAIIAPMLLDFYFNHPSKLMPNPSPL